MIFNKTIKKSKPNKLLDSKKGISIIKLTFKYFLFYDLHLFKNTYLVFNAFEFAIFMLLL